MLRRAFAYGVRLLLAAVLAVAPLARMSATADAAQTMPCHDRDGEAAQRATSGCPEGCCSDPACPPDLCVSAVAAVLAAAPVAARHGPAARDAVVDPTQPPTRPPDRRLRPPIG